MNTLATAHQAAMINLGCNAFVSLIITILVVGFIVWLATFILGFATFIAEPFKSGAIKLIYVFAAIYIVCVLLEVVFGIHIFNGMTPIGCSG